MVQILSFRQNLHSDLEKCFIICDPSNMCPPGVSFVFICSFPSICFHWVKSSVNTMCSITVTQMTHKSIFFDKLLSCLADIKSWMTQNLLLLNENKSEIILFCPTTTVTILQNHLESLSYTVRPTARNLDVIFDSDLTFEKLILTVVQACFYHLRCISRIRSFLLRPDLEKVIHAFISSRQDYCNSLYSICLLCMLVLNCCCSALCNRCFEKCSTNKVYYYHITIIF